jgi:hypothetical protein
MTHTVHPYEADLSPAASSSAHLRPSPEHPPAAAGQGGYMLVFSLAWTSFSLLFVVLPLLMF